METVFGRGTAGLLRNMRVEIPQLLHHDGTEYHDRTPLSHLFDGMSDQLCTTSSSPHPRGKGSPLRRVRHTEAEKNDNTWIQAAAAGLVWATGCTSWYVDAVTGRNTMLYPDWQFKFWLRSIFFPWTDFNLHRATKDLGGEKID